MENLLPKRFKVIIVAGALLVLLALVYSLGPAAPDGPDNDQVYRPVLKHIHQAEKSLQKKNHAFQKRAESVFAQYRANTLQHSRMLPKEALITEKNGVIDAYYGEIYYFKFRGMPVGRWAFILKNKDLYYTRKMAEHVYYFRFFCHLETNEFLQPMKHTFFASELKHSNEPLPGYKNNYQYDDAREMFFYDHLLDHSNRQLLLHLKFSVGDIEAYNKKNRQILAFAVIALVFLAGIWIFYKIKPHLSRMLWLALLADLFLLLPLWGEKNLYIKVMGFTLDSIYHVLIIIAFSASLLYFYRKKFKIRFLSYILFNVFLVIIIKIGDIVLKGVDFNYLDFSLNYLLLVTVLLLLHIIPLLFIRGIAQEFYYEMETARQKIRTGVLFIIIQALAAAGLCITLDIAAVPVFLLSIVCFVLLFFKRTLLSRLVVIFLLAASVYNLIYDYSASEKKDFIENNLKNIFLNQGNYAKLIAREIIHEINFRSRGDYYQFFMENASETLENIWKKTIASRENIASGIFVVSRENQLINHFAFQVPFIQLNAATIFPFWAMEETTAELNGGEISQAVGYIGIYRGWDYLGYIAVQVMNSPEFLLRYEEKVNIFTMDKKINGRDFSYVKLNAQDQIVENPSNINLENISGILRHDDRWIEFEAMEMDFTGYLFRYGGNPVIIFFPRGTAVKHFSEVIKIFLFFCLLLLLRYIRRLETIHWRSIYYSFSIRVFSFLILISLLTAIVFSVFFINFSARSSEQKVMRMVYENGRIAQNIGYNLIKRKSGFSQEQLLAISRILSSDVSVYENGSLVDTSNYRKVIESRIPEYLHSHILNLLNRKNQKFVLFEDEKAFYLFYKIYDYVFMVEFSNKWEKLLSEVRYYADFIITIFFVLVIVGFSAAFFFRNEIISPIEGLNKGMAEVERGNLPILKHIPSEIEIKRLYMGFNSMIEGIREQKRNISEISRMKTIIRFGRRVAHEVKNPLTPIQLSAEQILRALEDKNPNYEEIIKQSVNYIIDETDHLRKVSYGFLDLSRMDEIAPEAFDLVDLAREEMFNVRQIYSHIDFSIDTGEHDTVPVKLDKIKLKQVLKNLINNSIEAIGDKKGEIRVVMVKRGDRVTVEVIDNGSGMDESQFARAFDVDYSTKEIGTGLGLFIVKRIVELHKGSIDIRPGKNKGTRVILDLPGDVTA
jgi:signal transduction histidine kinase